MTNDKLLRSNPLRVTTHSQRLAGPRTAWHAARVPGQRHPDKTTLSVYLPRDLMQRLRRLATEKGTTVTAVVEAAVTRATRRVELTPEDHQQIERERREAMKVRRTPKPPRRR